MTLPVQNQTIKEAKIVHNGYNIEYVNTLQEVEIYIQNVISKYKHLNPQKICDKIVVRNDKRKQYTRLVRYRYATLYEEDFLIDVTYM